MSTESRINSFLRVFAFSSDERRETVCSSKGRWSVVTENPKEGSLKNLEGCRGGTTQFAWKMKTWRGGSRKSSKVIGGVTSVK